MADNGDPPMAEGEEGASEVTVQALEDMTPLVDFLCGMCPFALGGDPHAFRTAVESAETNAMLTAFAQDAGVPVLMVMKTVEEAAADEDGTVAAGVSSIVYSFEVEITPYEDNTTVIVFIKRGEVLEAGRSIFSQLLFLNLGHEKPFETLQQYLRGASLVLDIFEYILVLLLLLLLGWMVVVPSAFVLVLFWAGWLLPFFLGTLPVGSESRC